MIGAERFGGAVREGAHMIGYLIVPRPDQSLPVGSLTSLLVYPVRSSTMYLVVLRPQKDGGYRVLAHVRYKPTRTNSVESVMVEQEIEVSAVIM